MNSIDRDIVKGLAQDTIDDLKEDLIYHGWLEQCVKQRVGKGTPVSLYVRKVLQELLKSGEVEIGVTELSPDHLKFVPWKGTVEERVSRALEEVDRWSDDVKPYAYRLCLRKNIDRYHGE